MYITKQEVGAKGESFPIPPMAMSGLKNFSGLSTVLERTTHPTCDPIPHFSL